MFNLTVAEAHTFYVGVNGWLVHNANGTISPTDINSAAALRSKLSALQTAQQEATKTVKLPDGRIRITELKNRLKLLAQREELP